MRRRVMENGGAGIAPPPPQPLQARIAALSELPIAELRQAWSAAWGAPPPKGARRRLLMLGIAWKWQAEVEGGFSKPLERRLATLEAAFRQGGAPQLNGHGHSPTAAPARRPADPDLEDRAARGAGRRERLSLGRPQLGLALLHRPRDHRHPPQRPGLLRPARPGSAVTASPARADALRHLYPGLQRRGAGAGVQLARCAARGLRRLHPEPEARGLEHPAGALRRRRLFRRLDGPPRPAPAARRCSRPAGSMR